MPTFPPRGRFDTEVEPDATGHPAGHYRGRGGDQSRTGPGGPWLERRSSSRFLRPPDAGDEDSPSIPPWPSEEDFRSRTPPPKNYRRSDARIHDEVCQTLALHPEIDVSDVEVTVEDGVVTLSGRIDSRWSKLYAEDLALSVAGVDDVLNALRLR